MKRTQTFKIDPEAEQQVDSLARDYFFGNKSHTIRECIKFAYAHQRGFKKHIKDGQNEKKDDKREDSASGLE